jgi:hypothetical protein
MKKSSSIFIIFLIIIFSSIYFLFKHKDTLLPVTMVSQTPQIQEKKIVDKNDFYDIEITYPEDVLDKAHTIESFVTYQVTQKKDQWKIGGDAYNEEKKIEKDFPDKPKAQYQFYITYKKYESKKWNTVSYVFTTFEFTGGANGNSTVNTFTFSKDGTLAIDSILNFNNNNDIALTRLLANILLKRENASSDMVNDGLGLSFLKADGKTFDAKKCGCDGFFFPSNFQNFVVEDGGLRFLFNKYQVSPGVEGIPEIVMSYDMLKPYLLLPFK